jgi:dephospho-CoA kinase
VIFRGVVGLTGFTGAGKSTAIECVVDGGTGERVYLGQTVLDVIAERGLDNSGENQRLVRTELRKTYGEDHLIATACPRIVEILENKKMPMIDAVLSTVEDIYLKRRFPGAYRLVHVEAPLAVRVERIRMRSHGKMTHDDVVKRDDLEREKLKIEAVFQSADLRVANDGSREQLLDRLMAGLSYQRSS